MNKDIQRRDYRADDRMRDIIADDSLLLSTLSRFGIPLGFGDARICDVCRSNGVDTDTFLAVANLVSKGNGSGTRIDLKCIIRYLKQAHEYFLEFVLPSIRRRLIDALSATENSDIPLLIMKYFDEYSDEVKHHMDYEDRHVFAYVEQLLEGKGRPGYTISTFLAGHKPIASKLWNLKEMIICHYTGSATKVNQVNSALFDIIVCERDLLAHCQVEDSIFVPAVMELEQEVMTENEPSTENDENATALAELTDREREIITCVAMGLSNKEIADKLYLSVHTVATHQRNVASKLDIHSPSGLTIFAIVNNLIDLKDVKLTKD